MSWRVKVVNMKQRDDYIKEREFTYTNKCYILNMGLTHVNLGYGEKLFNSLITGFFRTMRLVLSIETPMIKSNYKYLQIAMIKIRNIKNRNKQVKVS